MIQKNGFIEFTGDKDFEALREFLEPFALKQKKQKIKGGISNDDQWNHLKQVKISQLEKEMKSDKDNWFLVQLRQNNDQ